MSTSAEIASLIQLQEDVKAFTQLKQTIAGLSRDLESKLVSIEGQVLKTLDVELITDQSLYFLVTGYSSELSATTYSDLSKNVFDITKPFNYNTERDYYEMIDIFRNNPRFLAQVLWEWDGSFPLPPSNGPAPSWPAGLGPGLVHRILTRAIMFDVLGRHHLSSGSPLDTNLSTPGTELSSQYMLEFLHAFIDIIYEDYTKKREEEEHAAATGSASDKPSSGLTWIQTLLSPSSIFPRFFSVYIRFACSQFVRGISAPLISTLQSHNSMDASPDWLAFFNAMHLIYSNGINPLGSGAPGGDNGAGSIPPPQPPSYAITSSSFMGNFTAFAHLNNIPLAQPNTLFQLTLSTLQAIIRSWSMLPSGLFSLFQKIAKYQGDVIAPITPPQPLVSHPFETQNCTALDLTSKDEKNDAGDDDLMIGGKDEAQNAEQEEQHVPVPSLHDAAAPTETESDKTASKVIEDPLSIVPVLKTPISPATSRTPPPTPKTVGVVAGHDASTGTTVSSPTQEPTVDRVRVVSYLSPTATTAFSPLLTAPEWSLQLPHILQPYHPSTVHDAYQNSLRLKTQGGANKSDSETQPTLHSSNGHDIIWLYEVLTSQLSSRQGGSADGDSTPQAVSPSIIDLFTKFVIAPGLHQPEAFEVVTANPVSALSRRNMLLVANMVVYLLRLTTTLTNDHIAKLQQRNAGVSYDAFSDLVLANVSCLFTIPSAVETHLESCPLPVRHTPSLAITSFSTLSHSPEIYRVVTLINQSLCLPQDLLRDFYSHVALNRHGADRTNHPVSPPSSQPIPYSSSMTTPQPTALALNAIYLLHHIAAQYYAKHGKDAVHAPPCYEEFTTVMNRLPSAAPILQPPQAKHGNRFLMLDISLGIIHRVNCILRDSDQSQQYFWSQTSLQKVVDELVSKHGDGSSRVQLTPATTTALRCACDTVLNTLNTLPHLSTLPLLMTPVAMASPTAGYTPLPPLPQDAVDLPLNHILSVASTYYASAGLLPRAVTIQESLEPIVGLPDSLTENNHQVLLDLIHRYFAAQSHSIKQGPLLHWLTLSSQSTVALQNQLKAREQRCYRLLHSLQLRKHVAAHSQTLLSFQTYLAQNLSNNVNHINGYQRVYCAVMHATLPYKGQQTTLTTTPSTSGTNPLLIHSPRQNTFNFATLAPSTQYEKAPHAGTGSTNGATTLITPLLKLPRLHIQNLTMTAINSLLKCNIHAFINLPLQGIISQVFYNCGGKYPHSPAQDQFTCSECLTRLQHVPRLLKSFLKKYMMDTTLSHQNYNAAANTSYQSLFLQSMAVVPYLTPPSNMANPSASPTKPLPAKRGMESTDIAQNGGGGYTRGIAGVIPPFTLSSAALQAPSQQQLTDTSSSPSFPPANLSINMLLDQVLSHTANKTFVMCPLIDTRWGSDMVFLSRLFPTFSSFYSYISSPQDDLVDTALVLPVVIRHILATIHSDYIEQNKTQESAPQKRNTTQEEDSEDTSSSEATLDDSKANNQSHTNTSSDQSTNDIDEFVDHFLTNLRRITIPNDNTPNSDKSATGSETNPILIKKLQVRKQIPYIGITQFSAAMQALETALTVSSCIGKLESFDLVRGVISTALSSPTLSCFPHTSPWAIDSVQNTLEQNTSCQRGSRSPQLVNLQDHGVSYELIQSRLVTHNAVCDSTDQPVFTDINNTSLPHVSYSRVRHQQDWDPDFTAQQQQHKDALLSLVDVPLTDPGNREIIAEFDQRFEHLMTPIRHPSTEASLYTFNNSYSADEFMFVLSYLLITSHPRHLLSTLSYLKIIYPDSDNYKGFMDICLSTRALQGINDRLRNATTRILRTLMHPTLLSRSLCDHMIPSLPLATAPPVQPTPGAIPPPALNKIELERRKLLVELFNQGYAYDDIVSMLSSLQPQAIFDTANRDSLITKIHALRRPTY